MIHDGKGAFFIPFAPDSFMLVVFYLLSLSKIEVLDRWVLLRKSSSILLNQGRGYLQLACNVLVIRLQLTC